MNKKLLNLLVSVLSFVMILTACGDGSTQNDTATTTTTINDTVSEKNNEANVTTKKEVFSEQDTTIEKEEQTTIEQETTTKEEEETSSVQVTTDTKLTLADVPAYSGKSYVSINNNIPYFTDTELTTKSYEYYSELDNLDRCGVTYACIGQDIMPTEERGNIGQVKPTGWHTVKYDCVDGKYLYNRCHLIGYQLTGENANTKNLITGTRSMNVDGMLPFENMVADYVQETGNHVMYRVTPMFDGNNLLASGVLMEAKSVEDDGDGVLFCVFVYNVQDGVVIDYATGSSWLEEVPTTEVPTTTQEQTTTTTQDSGNNDITYVLNKNTKKFHYSSCSSADDIKEENYDTYTGDRDDLIDMGYEPCKRCDP